MDLDTSGALLTVDVHREHHSRFTGEGRAPLRDSVRHLQATLHVQEVPVDETVGSSRPIMRMPALFGPTPGPRQWPSGAARTGSTQGTRAEISFHVSVDSRALSRLLPGGVTVAEPAIATVTFASLRDVEWLAGRGYNLVEVSASVRAAPLDGALAQFVLVVFENMADPIISGREELGWSKVYADISDVHVPVSDAELSVRWDGFEFLTGRVDDLDGAADPGATPQPRLYLKTIPATGAWGEDDCHYFTTLPPGDPFRTVEQRATGTGSLQLREGSFQELPTLVNIVQGLGDLSLSGPAKLTAAISHGGRSLRDQARL
jgi:hypothetical protein